MIYVGLVFGLVLLVFGGDLLVSGASRLAARWGISPLVVGLTIVAFGTSAPEFAVSLNAALGGTPDIALGNIVGSNIYNVLFILGAAALVAPLLVANEMVRREVPIMIGASLVTLLLALDGRVSRLDGAFLFAGILAYTGFAIVGARRSALAARRERDARDAEGPGVDTGVAPAGKDASSGWRAHPLANVASIVLGLVVLVAGSRLLVDGAVTLARGLGVSELVVGLTIVAIGTSLPELSASMIAAFKGERDIAVGNVIGSNIFNLLGVLGASAIVAPEGIAVAPGALAFDLPVMLAVAVACLPVFFVGNTVYRWEGGLFMAYAIAYTSYLILDAQEHPFTDGLGFALFGVAAPLTAVTIAIYAARHWRRVKAARASA